MMKRNLLRVFEAVIFCVLLAGVLAGVTEVMERKMSNERFRPFLEKAEDHDVLFIGDSHMVNSVFPMELWEKYGIASYNLSSFGNTLPVAYWTLMNALDYASPELVVIGIKDVEKNRKLTGSSSDVHTAFDGYPLTWTKYCAIQDLMDDPHAMDDVGNRYVDMKWEYLFTLGKYHTRWSEIGWSDFVYELSPQKGGNMMVGVAMPDDYDLIDPDRAADEVGWGFIYLRKIIETCQEREIDVLLTHLPYPSDPDDQMAANTVASIAEAYGVGFVDFVSMDQVVDYYTDCYDADSHLNLSGGQKVTDYLGDYIRTHYQIPDRREDPRYASWEEDAVRYGAYKRERLAGQKELKPVLMLLHDDAYTAEIAVREQAELYWDDQTLVLLHNAAREHVYEADAFAKWSNSMYPLAVLEDAVCDDAAYFLSLDRRAARAQEYAGSSAAEQAAQAFGSVVFDEGKEIRIRVRERKTGEEILDCQF